MTDRNPKRLLRAYDGTTVLLNKQKMCGNVVLDFCEICETNFRNKFSQKALDGFLKFLTYLYSGIFI